MSGGSEERLQALFRDACEQELRAFKPGNVSVYSEGHAMTVEDFRRSAEVAAPFVCAEKLSLGEKIYYSIEATRAAVGCNTNLGILLLAAPLLQSWHKRNQGETLRESLCKVLKSTTLSDADWVYRAIRLAQPGGLGEAAEQDVRDPPKVTLLEAMRLAGGRDRIARQYTNSFSDIFDLGIPRYDMWMSRWGKEDWVVVAIFAGLLGHIPDSHMERKFGARFTRMVADRMARIEQAFSVADEPEQVLPLLREADAEFKSHGINPGTTADITVACLLAVRLEKLSELLSIHR